MVPSTSDNLYKRRPEIYTGGLAVAAVPRPSEAPIMWDMPYWNPVKEPCTRTGLRPAHAKGVNVLYLDTHARYSAYANRSNALGPCWEDGWIPITTGGYYE